MGRGKLYYIAGRLLANGSKTLEDFRPFLCEMERHNVSLSRVKVRLHPLVREGLITVVDNVVSDNTNISIPSSTEIQKPSEAKPQGSAKKQYPITFISFVIGIILSSLFSFIYVNDTSFKEGLFSYNLLFNILLILFFTGSYLALSSLARRVKP